MPFKKLAKQLQEKQGYCKLPFSSYAWIPAIRYKRGTNERQKFQLHWLIEEQFGNPALVFLNGSTGYEAFFIENILTWPQESDEVAICAGCQNYDRIVCSHKDMVEICQKAFSLKDQKSSKP